MTIVSCMMIRKIDPVDISSDICALNHCFLVSILCCCRLTYSKLSSLHGQREGKEGKLNSVSLRILHSHGSASEEEVKKEMQRAIDGSRTELLRLVLQQDGSVVPRPCKDLFWKMCRILHVFYMKTDGFTSPNEMLGAVNSVIHEPLKVSHM